MSLQKFSPTYNSLRATAGARMRIIETVAEMTERARGWLNEGIVGLVPLVSFDDNEEQHALIREARARCAICIVCILHELPPFLGYHDDVPEDTQASTNALCDLEHELTFFKSVGVDVVFLPQIQELYPSGFSTYVALVDTPERERAELERECEIATLLVKVFHLVRPDLVYLGRQNSRQTAFIKQFVRDLNMDVEIRTLESEQRGEEGRISS